MKKLLFLTALILFFVSPISARNLAVEDFDPADTSFAEMYNTGVSDLIEELTISASDTDGNVLFSALTIPLELIVLQTQAEIHSRNITDPKQLGKLIADANSDKPGPGWFAFVIDGKREFVYGTLRMFYSIDPKGKTNNVDVIQIEAHDNPDGTSSAVWVMSLNDDKQLDEFLSSSMLGIAIQPVGGRSETSIDCTSWLNFTIFDLVE